MPEAIRLAERPSLTREWENEVGWDEKSAKCQGNSQYHIVWKSDMTSVWLMTDQNVDMSCHLTRGTCHWASLEAKTESKNGHSQTSTWTGRFDCSHVIKITFFMLRAYKNLSCSMRVFLHVLNHLLQWISTFNLCPMCECLCESVCDKVSISLDQTQVRKSEPQIPKTQFRLRLLSTSASFNLLLGRTQESDPLRQDTPAREKEETPSENQTTKAKSWMLVCDTQFILTSRLPRANV